MKELNIELKETDLELVVSEKTLGSLTTNAKQIKVFIESILPNYDVSNYNDENIENAKKDKALLNKASKALNAKRIEFEKEFIKPFSEFKDVVGETVKLISECSLKIDSVVKGYEQKEKEDKKNAIERYYIGTDFRLVEFEKIFEEKWLNKTSKEKDIRAEIDAKILKIKDDLKTLDSIGEDVALLKSLYLDTLNINNTIQYANTLKANRERVIAETRPAIDYVHQNIPQNVAQPASECKNEESQLLIRAFKVKATRESIILLSEFMNKNGIVFEKIEI